MNKDNYKTRFWALFNLVSNRNYTTTIEYKLLYFIYYFIILSEILSVLFKGNYFLLAVLSSIIFVFNGKKYEDRELNISEYLPISYKEKIKTIFFTTDLMLVLAVIVDFVVRYFYKEVNIVVYIYILLTLLIISNLAITQMIMTKRSIYNFIVLDLAIYLCTVMIMQLLLKNGFLANNIDLDFSLSKLIALVILFIVYRIFSIILLERFRHPSNKSYTIWKIVFVAIVILVFFSQIYNGIRSTHNSFYEGFKNGYNQEEKVKE